MKKLRYLIVDDDAAIRLIYKDFILDIQPDAEIFEAENGAQGICYYFEKKPDMVFLDMLMPVMDGDGFLDVLEAGIHIDILSTRPKVVVITAIQDIKQLIDIGRRMAVSAVISKPLQHKQLISLLNEQ